MNWIQTDTLNSHSTHMNVKGYDADGEITFFQVSSQNENHTAITSKFSDAMSKFPSYETELALQQILDEITESDYSRVVRFQCYREIAKSKILRQENRDAIPYLLKALRLEENRVDLWLQLSQCAAKAENASLFRAANSRLNKLRPDLKIDTNPPSLPALVLPGDTLSFVGFSLQQNCFRLFLKCIQISLPTRPWDIPEFQLGTKQILNLYEQPKYQIDHPQYLRFQEQAMPNNRHAVLSLGNKSLTDFIASMVTQEVSPNVWAFADPLIEVAANVLNKIATLPFSEPCPKDISLILIDLASEFLMERLKPSTKLFLAELATIYSPDKTQMFLDGIHTPNLHSRNALLRIAFATLNQSIRNNLDFKVLEKQLEACRLNLTEDLCLAHAKMIIDNKILEEKQQQINILKTISTSSQGENINPNELFSNPQALQFLSLENIISLFLQYDHQTSEQILPQLIYQLPDLVKKKTSSMDGLSKVFARVTQPLDDNCVKCLFSVFKELLSADADPELSFAAAMAIARSSENYTERATMLSTIHKQLGRIGACWLHNGKFLECLLNALLEKEDDFESELSTAFTCYFSDYQIMTVNHHSKLVLRCSKFLQPFYNHVLKLDRLDKEKSSVQLFLPYIGIWMHLKTCENHCIESIDGWKFYHVIKKNNNKLQKIELPKGYTPPMVLEDLLRHDPENRVETRVELAKVLLRKYLTSTETEPDNKELDEAIQLLSNESTPKLLILTCIAHIYKNENLDQITETLVGIPPFEDEPKKEARRLYWTMRMLTETNQKSRATDLARKAIVVSKQVPPDFAIPIICYAAEILNNKKLIIDFNAQFCKTKVLSPLLYLTLAKLSDPKESFGIISKIVRTTFINVLQFFHFEYKPPFLMYKPDDIHGIRTEIVKIYVESACESGNYKSLFNLFNPSAKMDRKASKVLTKNPMIFGYDRLDIFEKYIIELTKDYNKGPTPEDIDRAIDALVRGTQVDVSESLKTTLDNLFNLMWKKQTGNDPTPESSVQELINLLTANEEEDEEEDEDFVKGSGSEGEGDGEAEGEGEEDDEELEAEDDEGGSEGNSE